MALKLLVVEDNLDWRKIWEFVADLFEEGTTIAWATSVTEAEKNILEANLQGLPFDIVIADIFLSGGRTGLDLFEAVPFSYQERFLFVSSVKPENVQKHFKGHFSQVPFLQKPFGAHQMVGELRAILRKLKSPKPEVPHESSRNSQK